MNKMNTLGSRFFLLFGAITVPLLLILFIVGNYAKSVVLTQVANSYQNLVNSNLHMIDKSLEDITTYMLDIVNNDDDFQKFGKPGLSDSENYFTQFQLIHRNTIYQSYYHTVDMFFIYSKPKDRAYSTDMFGAASDDKEAVRAWIADSFHQPELIKGLMYKWSVIRIQDQHYLYRLVSDDLTNNAYIGAIISMNSLKIPLGNLDLREGGDVLFVGDDGTVLSNPSSSLKAIQRLDADKLQKSQSFTLSNGKSKLLAVTSRSANSGISMAVLLPNSELLRGLSGFQIMINLLPLFVVVTLILYISIFRSIIFNPIRQLLKAIRRIKEGDMNTRLPDSSITEFALINHSFNRMVAEITDLKINVYEERLRSQQAELKHLQLQINPHFFLNTMNIIFQLADLKRYELVKKTVRHLMQYFRFMLRSKRDMITISQEMDHIIHYLEIQKMRYQDSFMFDIRLPDDLHHVQIPSLLIQPFVENAMIHGMSVKTTPFMMQISVERPGGTEDMIAIELRDNGKGMTSEQRMEFNSEGYAPDSEDSHIGIWNVKRRLAMRYGGKAQLVFHHNEPKGVRIRLLLPIEYAEEGTKDVQHADRGR
ncbi:sensor histidine kinase [Paenibacillus beijingensis]|uniref:Helicase Ski2 n=1 Tax=Paenibacillus beijingensis TaxID=1126833 RepID=A0A0D5NFI5_9BACL|nr:histidine kinase [Paenibacillus beijingensis]AJY73915.1 helicase Ski2 [Paenibacillus beijingensis]